jgi:hypothetical protein
MGSGTRFPVLDLSPKHGQLLDTNLGTSTGKAIRGMRVQ